MVKGVVCCSATKMGTVEIVPFVVHEAVGGLCHGRPDWHTDFRMEVMYSFVQLTVVEFTAAEEAEGSPVRLQPVIR
jgi:hypothetical protein